MNSFFVYGIIFLILLVLELAYFKVADRFNIIDKPNQRSSHSSIVLDPSSGNYGCVVPAGTWHTVEVLEPSVIYEAKDGKYGEDGSEAV